MSKNREVLLRAAFVAYIGFMLWLLFGQRFDGGFAWEWAQVWERINLKPLHTIKSYLWVLENDRSQTAMRHAAINLVGNVVMFLPLGYFFAVLFQPMRKFWRMLLYTVLLICAVECLQLLTMLGSCDVDDLLLNLVGVIFGWCIGMAIRKK